MGGGNAHQRAIETAKRSRIERKVEQAIGRVLGSGLAQQETPWYERGSFFFGVSTAIAIVLAVLAAMLKDLRWLMLVALPFVELSLCVACEPLKVSGWHWRKILLVLLSVGALTGSFFAYRALPLPTNIGVDRGGKDKTTITQPSQDITQIESQLKQIEKNTELESKPASPASQGFAVDIEHRIFTSPGAVTSFWFGSFGPGSCSLQPTGAAIFLRISNSEPQDEMITAYSFDNLDKTPVTHGRMFQIFPRGAIPDNFSPRSIDWGAPQGLGALVTFPVSDADASRSIPISGDLFDYKIGEGHYLKTNEPVRGWVFFQFHNGQAMVPVGLKVHITDQFQRTFSYTIPDHDGDPAGDTLSRRIVQSSLEDLSECHIYTN